MTDNKKKKPLGLLLRLRNNFTTGILVLAPTAVTIWILIQLFNWFDNILGKWYTWLFARLEFGDIHIPGLGAVTLAVLVTLVGVLTRHYAGRQVLILATKL